MLMRNPYLSLGLAGVLGIGAAVLASHWIQGRVSAAEQRLRGDQPVVVTTTEIPFGSRIEKQYLGVLYWPRGTAPEGAFDSIDKVAGKFAAQKLVQGEMVMRERVVDQNVGNSLSMMIEPNKRAVSVRVNDVIGVAGFLLPGNHVDVIATRRVEQNRAEAHTLLQNVKVLAVDQTAAQPEKDKPVVVRAVTLELDVKQAELLAAATEEGSVQLALRNPDDTTVTEPQPEVALASASAEAKPAPQVVYVTRKPRTDTVTVIRETRVGVSNVKSETKQ